MSVEVAPTAPTASAAPVAAWRLSRRRADRSRLRSAAVVLFLPALVMALFWLSATWQVAPFANSPYSPALATKSNDALVIVGSYLAVAAAWEMGALRVVWGRLTVTRSWGRAVLGRLGLVLGSDAVMMVLVYAVTGGATFLRHGPDVGLVAVSAAGVLAWTPFGAALALALRPLLALPLALLLPFLVMSLPQGWSPLWIRHVNGYLSDCCSTSQVLDQRAVHASLGFLLAVLVCSTAAMAVRLAKDDGHARHTLPAATTASVLALAGAAALIAPVTALGAVPTRQRPIAALQCQDELCLWTEDAVARPANQTAWDDAQAAWAALHLPPLTVTRIGPVPQRGVLGIASSSTAVDQASESIATVLPRELAGCHDQYSDARRDIALGRLGYLLLAASAHHPQFLPPTLDGSTPRPANAPALWASVTPCR